MTDNLHYVTPKEADLKFCPFKQGMITGCDGIKCMAWRWAQSSGKIWFWAETDRDPKPRENWIPIEEWEFEGKKAGKFREGATHGYCGMVQS